jgi:hypothetical protein
MGLLQIEAFKVIGINTDALEKEQIEAIEKALASENWSDDPLVFRFSFLKKLEQLGISPTKALTEVVTINQGRVGQSINTVFESMLKLQQLAEHMQAMSAAEMGQSEPREISATQTPAPRALSRSRSRIATRSPPSRRLASRPGWARMKMSRATPNGER